jgi:FKBP-type peptidyl-prolyl cis-trans isomerase SlyD
VRAEEKGDLPMVENGKQVSIEYTLRLDDGSTADSNVGEDALIFEQGAHQILPALESALAGLKVGESKQVTLTAEDGYGQVDPEAFQSVPTENIPEDAREVGAMLVAQDGAGNKRPVRVHEVGTEAVIIDLNHPLAGQNLNFDVRVLEVK